tara:strand:- start:124 stop:780 length:657 start_codon:yes stop_codon:yes gene_type:complete
MTALQKLLTPRKVKKKIRIGEQEGDGGYVVSANHLSNHLISLGCCDNTSFEESYLKEIKGDYKVEIYDGTGGCDLAEKDGNVTFFNKNVYSLEEMNIPEECFIQCDIEGSEFHVFSEENEKMKSIKQICLEVHFNIGKPLEGWIKFFERFNSTHSLVHIHGNNCVQSFFEGVPTVTELTYVLSNDLEDCGAHDRGCPHKDLDQPNNINLPELEFCWWL